MLLPGRNAVFGGGGVTSGFADASFALVLASCVMLLALVVMTSSTPSGTSVLLVSSREQASVSAGSGGRAGQEKVQPLLHTKHLAFQGVIQDLGLSWLMRLCSLLAEFASELC
jgi:hypothetical protein